MSFLFQLYRILVPKPIRTRILLASLRKRIPAFHASDPSFASDTERKEVIDFVERHGVKIFPYSFTAHYNQSSVMVHTDASAGLKYVVQDNKRLYFKRRWSTSRIQRSFHDLSMEQDPQSPHRYLTDDFNLDTDDVVADFGAAEGNFSLSVIERVSKVYLFESDPEWIEALEMTFAPWREKVEIIPKFVSDQTNAQYCKGDDFFADKKISFLKIDVDGGERKLLKGLTHVLETVHPLKIALCTYHQHHDLEEFTGLLEQSGCTVRPSSGYMIFYYDKRLQAPFLRRGLIRAKKD